MERKQLETKTREMQRILLGRRYEGVSLGQIRAGDEVQKKVLNFMDKKENMLVYCGNPGIGKTFLCASLFEWAIDSFTSFRYYTEYELLKRVRSVIETNGDTVKELQHLLDDPLVFIDDIGSQKNNDWRTEILFAAIDIRYNSMLPTVVTSNLTRKEFEENYNKRVESRLFSKDNIVIEVHNGEDFRQSSFVKSVEQEKTKK